MLPSLRSVGVGTGGDGAATLRGELGDRVEQTEREGERTFMLNSLCPDAKSAPPTTVRTISDVADLLGIHRVRVVGQDDVVGQLAGGDGTLDRFLTRRPGAL